MAYYVCAVCNKIGTHGTSYTRDWVIETFPTFCYYEHNDGLVTDIETRAEAVRWLDYLTGKTTVAPWEQASK
jgi:hypothetical protein